MNNGGHVILCGQISQYNKDVPYPPPLNDETQGTLQKKHITRERFMVLNYMGKAEAALCELSQWVKSGQIKVMRKLWCGWLRGCPCLFAECMPLPYPSLCIFCNLALILQVLETMVNGIENMGGK